MANGTARIIKAGRIKVEGVHRVELAAAQTAPGGAGGRARIVDRQQNFAVIEFVCGCGQRSLIRCEYGQS